MPSFDADRRVEFLQVRNRLREIEATIYSQRQPVEGLTVCVTGPGKGPERAPKSGFKAFPMFGRWGGFDQTTWFRMKLRVPETMRGRRVVALLRPGGESLAYVNGVPAQGLDSNRDEVYLTEKAKGGETYEILLEGVPSVRDDVHHHFQYADFAVMHTDVWDLYWDCQVVWEVLEQLEQNSVAYRRLLDVLNTGVKTVDLQHKGEPAYYASVAKARAVLKKGLKELESGFGMGKLTVVGQSHIDTAWLWPLRETRRKCGRTFSTVLGLLDRYPDFVFMCSQAIQYEWIKEDYPELYKRIKQRVKEGRWEIGGAPLVEPDHNVPSGESLIRQYTYGNRFFEREFGLRSRTAWIPDSFGYTWSLPQILKKCQIDYFITTKITWSRFTQFPYSLFQWEAPDGSRIMAIMPPMNYNGNPSPKDCIAQWKLFHEKELVDEIPFPIGYGDGGGGPTMSMVEHGRRLANITGIPKCSFGRNEECLDRIAGQVSPEQLPVYSGELYLELHRGCQTTQARTKRHNRKCEVLLHDAEFLSSLALLLGGRYAHDTLYEAWKIVLVNQFHDILPGSSITEVYKDTERDYARARELAESARHDAVKSLLSKINTSGEGTPIVVFNTLAWERDDTVCVTFKRPKGHFAVLDASGKQVSHQITEADEVLFTASGVPALGYAVYRVVASREVSETINPVKASVSLLENELLRVRIDKNGQLTSVYDKANRRKALADGVRGNVLQLFDDRPAENDAWDIDPNFEEIAWEPKPAESVTLVESGPVRASVRVVRRTEKSVIMQDITLYAGSARIDFVTRVEWHERRVLMKAAFPVDIRAPRATYEIQYATIERATHQNTAFDRARFEAPAQRWADLSEGDYGVSLLNDCKYGYDVRDNVLRLSLLRAPVNPDPKADEGYHEFTYSLYPHAWGWRNGVVREGLALNCPLYAVVAEGSKRTLPHTFSLVSVDAPHVVIDTVKRAEDSNALVVRLYEAHGQRGDVTLAFFRPPKKVTECDMMEENDRPVKTKSSAVKFYIKPYEIRTFKVVFQ